MRDGGAGLLQMYISRYRSSDPFSQTSDSMTSCYMGPFISTSQAPRPESSEFHATDAIALTCLGVPALPKVIQQE